MAVMYEVWDTETANQIATFDAEQEARSFLVEMLDLNGAKAVESLMLGAWEVDEAGAIQQWLVVDGRDIACGGSR